MTPRPDQQDMLVELLGGLPAGSQPVETSEAAADSLTPKRLAKTRRRVLEWFFVQGKTGGTADELELAFDLGHNSTSPRITELMAMGYVERLDGEGGRESRKRPTRRGKDAFVHVITDLGKRMLVKLRAAA